MLCWEYYAGWCTGLNLEENPYIGAKGCVSFFFAEIFDIVLRALWQMMVGGWVVVDHPTQLICIWIFICWTTAMSVVHWTKLGREPAWVCPDYTLPSPLFSHFSDHFSTKTLPPPVAQPSLFHIKWMARAGPIMGPGLITFSTKTCCASSYCNTE